MLEDISKTSTNPSSNLQRNGPGIPGISITESIKVWFFSSPWESPLAKNPLKLRHGHPWRTEKSHPIWNLGEKKRT